MALHVHRSNRAEALADALAAVLAAGWPADPLATVPVVVGSRGMERWLRHELATRLGVAAGIDFPFPRQAFDGAAAWLLDPARDPDARFWAGDPGERTWDPEPLAFRLIGRLRARRATADPAFDAVRRYLDDPAARAAAPDAIGARELRFARDVADVLDRLMHDRPADALAWARAPGSAPEAHQWLATLLADLGADADDAPARRLERLAAARPGPTGRPLHLFGLSSLGPGDRIRLARLADALELHLYALVPSDRWWQDVRDRSDPRHNPLLTSLGGPSRDLQGWLEEAGYVDDTLPSVDPSTAPGATLLHRVQGWVLRAEGLDDLGGPLPADDTLSLHATWGALRQCEVLHGQLLELFAADPSLQPRDVVVMTPDVETWAPLVAATFARRVRGSPDGVRLPAIPCAIADLGLRRTNPLAEVLLAVLALAEERVTATRLVGLLALEPVRLALGLDDEDPAALEGLVRQAAVRWGLDADDRGRADQPALDQNTVRFGLERLALGALMPDPGGLQAVAADGGLGPAVPLDPGGTEGTRRTARLIGLFRTLQWARDALAGPHTGPEWRDRLAEVLDAVARAPAAAPWLRVDVLEVLDALAALAGPEGLPIARDAIRRWLEGRFDLPLRGDRPQTGAVTVCALEPMRSVPFRVVALIGMDDGSFPRADRPRAWDPMGDRRPGERDRRQLDRHLLLEALLSARDRLIVLWRGRDQQTGEALPAAVPVEELRELLGRICGVDGDALVRTWPLQPWSPSAFASPGSFDAGMAQAARRVAAVARGEAAGARSGLGVGLSAPLPDEPIDTLPIEGLVEALVHPARAFLTGRMGLYLRREDAEAPRDREPLELDTLEAWSLRARVRRELEEGGAAPTVDAFAARLAGEGLLPLRAGGRRVLAEELEKALRIAAHRDDVAGEPIDPVALRVRVDGLVLTGRVADARARDGRWLLQWASDSAMANDRQRLEAWVHLLAAAAMDLPVDGARLVGHGDRATFLAPPEDPAAALSALVRTWRDARNGPIPLFRRTSLAVAEQLALGEEDRERLARAAARGWSSAFDTPADLPDRWIEALWPDFDPEAAIRAGDPDGAALIALADRVWRPLVDADSAGGALARAWAP